MRRVLHACAAFALVVACSAARANSDPLSGLVAEGGGAGLGAAVLVERSRYAGGGRRNDLVPLNLYQGKHFYLHASRIGLHLDAGPRHRFDAFLAQRFEGFPSDRVPASLAGMAERQNGFDIGGRLVNSGNTSWTGQCVGNHWKNCIFKTTGYVFTQDLLNGALIENCVFASNHSFPLWLLADTKNTIIRNCTFAAWNSPVIKGGGGSRLGG